MAVRDDRSGQAGQAPDRAQARAREGSGIIKRILFAGAAFLLLAGYTTADIEMTSEERIITHVHFTRFASSVGFQMSPDGTVAYTSSPETQAANSLAGAVLNLPRTMPGAQP
jgi:hypothetical protein